ncbi:MAG: LacI family transcriptional regulator [Chloroflexi bacterium]|nr:MAG: LacI family transcriptional regulator [Chloroflexota bacterium]
MSSTSEREFQNVTIHDVARLAGVGVGTVSRVLNNHRHVSEATRERVLAAIETLDYRPDLAARGLRMGRTHTIGVLVPFFTHHFFVEILRGAERAVAQTDYSLVVFDVERPEERDEYLQEASLAQRVDGLLVISLVPHPGDLERFKARGFPVVLVDAHHEEFSSIEVDHRQAAAEAVQHLLRLGHTKIGFIDRLEDPFTPKYRPGRQAGYRDALAERGVPVRPEYVFVEAFSREGGYRGAQRLLALPDPPTAIFTATDIQAVGAIEAVWESGRQVPEDVAVVGYNNVEMAEYLGLTTMNLPTEEMGRQGVEILLATIDGQQQKPVHIQLAANLVVRISCGAEPSPPHGWRFPLQARGYRPAPGG